MERCSIVVPVYNEAENLRPLCARITRVLAEMDVSYEIIFVDDGSSDGSAAILRELCQDGRIKLVKFSRNFGHHAALTAGIDHATGDVVVTMDGDLQDRPEEIPALTGGLGNGYDVAYAVRTGRRDSIAKRVTSAIFTTLMSRVIAPGVPMHGSVFMAMNRKVVDALAQCRETSRSISALIGWLGFRQTTVRVAHGERHAGESKYNFWRSLKLAVNTITSFSYVPLRIATWVGLLASLGSFAFAARVLVQKLVWDVPIQGYPSLMVAVLFLGGAQLTMLGILGEYLGRSYTQLQNRPLYVVEEVVGHRSTPADPARPRESAEATQVTRV